MNRNRLCYFVVGGVVVALGLASRRYGTVLPPLLTRYAGDTLWATMVFVGIGFMARHWSVLRVALSALVMCYAVEVSQLYHPPWLETVRQTWVGALALGHGFLWSDLVCYTVGVALGAVLDAGVTCRWSTSRALPK